MAELNASFQRAQLVQKTFNPKDRGPVVFSAICNQIGNDEEPVTNFQGLNDDLKEEHSEPEYDDVDTESLLQPVRQFHAHLNAVRV